MNNPEQRNKDDHAAMVKMFEHMATFGGGPAYPQQMQYGVADNGQPAVWFSVGLTKREKFAAMMMAALITKTDLGSDERVADVSVGYADALLERLKK